ncbi:MICOS complex subunit mic25-a-like isoform X1 [Erpetoichthys calabaricus]|uniref:Uncharacterized protein n=1 Tax=Erpetoichthys calabaricus TaxID=27687 RepID=A0A8C4XG81_ERPCA|nr:MICOS complex subunit mic25-a-like isoform X1 [Erpetoichthys calabaricus]
MGGSESTVRKVSFAMDEEDKVRVLPAGVKLSDAVIQRAKDRSHSLPESKPPPSKRSEGGPSATGPPKSQEGRSGKTYTEREEELYRRYEREQALVQEELARIAQRERAAARENLNFAILQERASTVEEIQKAKVLPADLDAWAKQLEKKEAELKRLDTFYKEQLAHLERKNVEYYKLTSEQFHEAANEAEAHIKKRRTEPLCSDLQSGILKCYRDNQQQTLNCSDLAKEYMQCINAAKKKLLVNHG